MSPIARTVYLYGLYLIVAGLFFLLLPGWFGPLFGVVREDHGWLRLIGLLIADLGLFYSFIGRYDHEPLCRLTVFARVGVAIVAALLVFSGSVPKPFLLLGLIDLAGAIWTQLQPAKRRSTWR